MVADKVADMEVDGRPVKSSIKADPVSAQLADRNVVS